MGTIVGAGTSLWLSIGAQVAAAAGQLVQERKLVGTDCGNCTITLPEIPDPYDKNSTSNENLRVKNALFSSDEVFDAYRISYLYYTPISCILTIIVGIIVSGVTGWQKPSDLDPMLLSPLIRDKFFKKKNVRKIIL